MEPGRTPMSPSVHGKTEQQKRALRVRACIVTIQKAGQELKLYTPAPNNKTIYFPFQSNGRTTQHIQKPADGDRHGSDVLPSFLCLQPPARARSPRHGHGVPLPRLQGGRGAQEGARCHPRHPLRRSQGSAPRRLSGTAGLQPAPAIDDHQLVWCVLTSPCRWPQTKRNSRGSERT